MQLTIILMDYDELHEKLINDVPKYGNDDDDADDIVRKVFEIYFDSNRR